MTCVLQFITHHYDHYTCSHLCGPDNTWPARCGSATSVPDTFLGIWHLCHWFFACNLIYQSQASQWFIMSWVGGCCGVCFMLWGSHVAAMFTYVGSTIRVCNTAFPQRLCLTNICASWWCYVAHARNALSGCPPLVWVGLAWWFFCSDWVSGWWIYSHLVGRAFHCMVTHLTWFHC